MLPSRQVGEPVPIALSTTMVAPVGLMACNVMVAPPLGSLKDCPAVVRPVNVLLDGVMLRSIVHVLFCARPAVVLAVPRMSSLA